jgi:hypothetical protein
MTPTNAKDGKSNVIDGESAIEDALASTGASKLQKEITDSNADALRTRAETMLWIGSDRQARWKDVEDRAISNVRWPWLPPKGDRGGAAGTPRDRGRSGLRGTGPKVWRGGRSGCGAEGQRQP